MTPPVQAVGHGRTAWLAWSLAALLVAQLLGCGSAPVQTAPPRSGAPQAPQPLPPASREDVPSAISPEQAQGVTVYALGLVGTPYRYGGNTPETGFDCSGLINHVYRKHAQVNPPRTVAGLKNWGRPVGREQLRAGDLAVFFQGATATHAGIYVGEGRFVHAPSTGGRVRMDSLNSNYWARQTVVFQRP